MTYLFRSGDAHFSWTKMWLHYQSVTALITIAQSSKTSDEKYLILFLTKNNTEQVKTA